MLTVHELDASHGDLQALWQVSLTVEDGEIVALLGPNGAGKTTLLRTIAGVHRPTAGHIMLHGNPIDQLPPHRIVEAGVVLVPEGRRLFSTMTVLENLEMGAYTGRARKERAQTLRSVYDTFPILAERHGQLAASLSGGQQQMLAIGRALMALPRLLLLDEPSLGLAPLVVQSIFDVIGTLNRRGVTVLLVEQNAYMALEVAAHAYVMEQGRIAAYGSGDELLRDDRIRQAYLGYGPAEAATL